MLQGACWVLGTSRLFICHGGWPRLLITKPEQQVRDALLTLLRRVLSMKANLYESPKHRILPPISIPEAGAADLMKALYDSRSSPIVVRRRPLANST